MVQPTEQQEAVEPVGGRTEGTSGNAGSQQGDSGKGDHSGGQGGTQGMAAPPPQAGAWPHGCPAGCCWGSPLPLVSASVTPAQD
jgi:hypothetical protein